MDLSFVNQTEYYAGLFKSSPKVTLHLSVENSTTNGIGGGGNGIVSSGEQENAFESWECEVCSYRNPPGLSPAAARICGLCGVPRSSVPTASKALSVPARQLQQQQQHLSSSLPSSAAASVFSSTTSLHTGSSNTNAAHKRPPSAIACTACTFLNHPSLRACEMCSTPLPSPLPPTGISMKSAPSSRPASPDVDEDDNDSRDPQTMMIKLSFRQGGVKAFYAVLKRSLKSKAWEVSVNFVSCCSFVVDLIGIRVKELDRVNLRDAVLVLLAWIRMIMVLLVDLEFVRPFFFKFNTPAHTNSV
jgi:ESCRT-II complex subunit VPS36